MSGKRNYKPWTTTEIATLRRQYSTTPIEIIAEKLGRSVIAIQGRASREHISSGRKRSNWKKICAEHRPTFALR